MKQDGDKLTGATVRNDNETAIQDGKVAGDEVSFTVARERDGRKVTAKYKGKIKGDSVKGTLESDWSGDWQTLEWEGTAPNDLPVTGMKHVPGVGGAFLLRAKSLGRLSAAAACTTKINEAGAAGQQGAFGCHECFQGATLVDKTLK